MIAALRGVLSSLGRSVGPRRAAPPPAGGLARLAGVCRRLADAPLDEALVQRIPELCRELAGASAVALFRVEGGEPVLRGMAGDRGAALVPTPVARGCAPALDAALTGRVETVRDPGHAPAGLGHACPAVVVPLSRAGAVVGVLWVAAAGTDRWSPADRLELEVFAAHAAASLHAARVEEEAQWAGEGRTARIATVAHEFRGPLGAIASALHLLERTGARDDRSVHLRQLMRRQLGNLVRLVDDLMEAARAEHGKIRVRRAPIDLREVVRHAVESLAMSGRADHHSVGQALGGGPVIVPGDPTRLEQVVRNLLDNALKYSPAGTTIRASIECTPGEAVLRVRDDGIGIAADMLPRLFEPFAQADRALDRAAGGLGLGLPLVRAIVEEHGGSVDAVSEGRGRGSEFVVRLPLATPGAESPEGAG